MRFHLDSFPSNFIWFHYSECGGRARIAGERGREGGKAGGESGTIHGSVRGKLGGRKEVGGRKRKYEKIKK